jgi:hypothetical protein
MPQRTSEDVVLDALTRAAQFGVRCPSNEELGALLDYGVSAPPGILRRLEMRGVIKVDRYQRERRVTIIATGQQTSEVRTPAVHWRDRPQDVPSPPAHAVAAKRPDTARDVFATARRLGRSPADFLADLVWIGWAHWQEQEIQPGASEGMV